MKYKTIAVSILVASSSLSLFAAAGGDIETAFEKVERLAGGEFNEFRQQLEVLSESADEVSKVIDAERVRVLMWNVFKTHKEEGANPYSGFYKALKTLLTFNPDLTYRLEGGQNFLSVVARMDLREYEHMRGCEGQMVLNDYEDFVYTIIRRMKQLPSPILPGETCSDRRFGSHTWADHALCCALGMGVNCVPRLLLEDNDVRFMKLDAKGVYDQTPIDYLRSGESLYSNAAQLISKIEERMNDGDH